MKISEVKMCFVRPRRGFAGIVVLMAGVLALQGAAAQAEAARGACERIDCGGEYKGHLQGVATDGAFLYWSFTDELVKTDLSGAVLCSVAVPRHHGDLCVRDGTVYVAVNRGTFNSEDRAVSEVSAYSAADLGFRRTWKLPMCGHGAGGMTWAGGRFFVVGGLPATHECNYVYEFTPDFRLVKRHELATGFTLMGIQTAAFEDGRFLFGIYGCKGDPGGVLECPRDLGSFVRRCGQGDVGIVKLDGDYWTGRTKSNANKHYIGYLVRERGYPASAKPYEPERTDKGAVKLFFEGEVPEGWRDSGYTLRPDGYHPLCCAEKEFGVYFPVAELENAATAVSAVGIGGDRAYSAPDLVRAVRRVAQTGEAFALHVVGTPREAKADPKLCEAVKAVRDEARRLGVKLIVAQSARAEDVPGLHELKDWSGNYAVSLERPDCEYPCGETAHLKVTALDAGGVPAKEGTLDLSVDNFGTNVVLRRTVDLAKENPFSVEGSLAKPGALRFTFRRKGVKDGVWGVTFAADRIRAAAPEPKDFTAFWKKAMRDLERTVPLDPQIVPLPERASPAWDYYRVSFASYGRRVYGFLSVPKDRTKGPFPVRMELPSAGRGLYSIDLKGSATEVRMMITVHPFESPLDKEGFFALYDRTGAERAKAHSVGHACAGGLEISREDYFYYPVILGAVRAVNWLRKQDYVDRNDFTYCGGSQGGGLGLWLCALNPCFRKAVFFVPALCDLQAYRVGRQSGGLHPVEYHKPENRPAAERNVGYFDAANFARHVKCPVRMTVGLSDTTCPPPTVYAAFNALPAKDKEILRMPGFPHGCKPEMNAELEKWRREK